MSILANRRLDISITKAEIKLGGRHATQLRNLRAMIYENDIFMSSRKSWYARYNRLLDIAKFYHRNRYDPNVDNWGKCVRVMKLINFYNSL